MENTIDDFLRMRLRDDRDVILVKEIYQRFASSRKKDIEKALAKLVRQGKYETVMFKRKIAYQKQQ